MVDDEEGGGKQEMVYEVTGQEEERVRNNEREETGGKGREAEDGEARDRGQERTEGFRTYNGAEVPCGAFGMDGEVQTGRGVPGDGDNVEFTEPLAGAGDGLCVMVDQSHFRDIPVEYHLFTFSIVRIYQPLLIKSSLYVTAAKPVVMIEEALVDGRQNKSSHTEFFMGEQVDLFQVSVERIHRTAKSWRGQISVVIDMEEHITRFWDQFIEQ
jgi:hypothetical protein